MAYDEESHFKAATGLPVCTGACTPKSSRWRRIAQRIAIGILALYIPLSTAATILFFYDYSQQLIWRTNMMHITNQGVMNSYDTQTSLSQLMYLAPDFVDVTDTDGQPSTWIFPPHLEDMAYEQDPSQPSTSYLKRTVDMQEQVGKPTEYEEKEGAMWRQYGINKYQTTRRDPRIYTEAMLAESSYERNRLAQEDFDRMGAEAEQATTNSHTKRSEKFLIPSTFQADDEAELYEDFLRSMTQSNTNEHTKRSENMLIPSTSLAQDDVETVRLLEDFVRTAAKAEETSPEGTSLGDHLKAYHDAKLAPEDPTTEAEIPSDDEAEEEVEEDVQEDVGEDVIETVFEGEIETPAVRKRQGFEEHDYEEDMEELAEIFDLLEKEADEEPVEEESGFYLENHEHARPDQIFVPPRGFEEEHHDIARGPWSDNAIPRPGYGFPIREKPKAGAHRPFPYRPLQPDNL